MSLRLFSRLLLCGLLLAACAPVLQQLPTQTIPRHDPAASATPTVPPNPTRTATRTPTAFPSPSATARPTASPAPTASATSTATRIPTATSTATPEPAPSRAPTATVTPRATALPPSGTVTVTQVPPDEVAGWPAQVLEQINAVRAEHELPPYRYDTTLARAAQLHAQECQERGSCSHVGSDGSTPDERIERAGYDAIAWAEIIAHARSPEQAVERWMDEVPPDDLHRRTVLGTWVEEIGIGVAPAEQAGYYYIIADLGSPAAP